MAPGLTLGRSTAKIAAAAWLTILLACPAAFADEAASRLVDQLAERLSPDGRVFAPGLQVAAVALRLVRVHVPLPGSGLHPIENDWGAGAEPKRTNI